MTPESIVVSLPLAEKLRAAGWDRETVFVYYQTYSSYTREVGHRLSLRENAPASSTRLHAPTLSELLQALPETQEMDGAGVGEDEPYLYSVPWVMMPDGGAVGIGYDGPAFVHENAAEATAALWLTLNRSEEVGA